ncbi:MAG: hypothetical protein IMW86_00310 [Hydrogenibacillus sp.]|nr:hypothetical protein [Hydrogenibacillus sp.]
MDETSLEAREPSRFEWFVYVVLIPGFFALVVAGVTLAFFNINVLDIGRSLYEDVRAWVRPGSSGAPAVSETAALRSELERLQHELAQTAAALAEREAKLAAEQQSNEALMKENAALKEALDAAKAHADEALAREKAVARALSQLSPAKAADIVVLLDPALAVGILTRMNADAQAALLGKMPPEAAAKLVAELAGGSRSGTDEAVKTFALTLKAMPPEEAATLIGGLWQKRQADSVIRALEAMDADTRGAILAKMPTALGREVAARLVGP